MVQLLDLPDEIRLAIFEFTFNHLRLKYRVPTRKRRRTPTTDDTPYAPAFSLFQVSKAFWQDPMLHKALRTAPTIHFTTHHDISSLHNALQTKPTHIPELHHFSFEWKPRSVCPGGRTGKSIDAITHTIKSLFPGTLSLTITENRFQVTLLHPTAEDLQLMSNHALEHGTLTRYRDDCGNTSDFRHVVYNYLHCCAKCIDHHVLALRAGVELTFAIRLKLGHSFGRPGMADGFCHASMSTRDYMLRIVTETRVFEIPQRSFEDIQQHPPDKNDGAGFVYHFQKDGAPVRTLSVSGGAVLRRYEEDKVWRAG